MWAKLADNSFAIITGVVGSLLAAILLIIFVKLRNRMSKLVPLVKRLLYRRKRRRIVVLLPHLSSSGFFTSFTDEIIMALETLGFDAVLKPARRDGNAVDQDQQLNRILQYADEYDACLMVVKEPTVRRGKIKEFVEQFGKPVVFLDDPVFENAAEYPEGTCFVGADNTIGGQEAGRAMIHFFEERYSAEKMPANPHILVIASKSQTERQNSFILTIKGRFPLADIVTNEDGDFSRVEACKIVGHYLRQSWKRKEFYDAIFVTNDEMALGVIDALHQITPEVAEEVRKHMVCMIGYDGIPCVLRIIERDHSLLKNTVVQDRRELALLAVDSLFKLVEADNPHPEKVVLRPPKLAVPFNGNRRTNSSVRVEPETVEESRTGT